MEIGITVISSSSSSSLEQPTARQVGPENMIHSPNCFTLPCAVPFHKINAGYEATTTVNSSCLRTVTISTPFYYTIKMQHALTYEYTHACSCIYTLQNLVEQVQSFHYMNDGIHYAKNRGNKEIPLAILSRILAQSCVTPPYIIQAKGYA